VKHIFSLLDRLAHIRTILASERTFLAYQRTALALFVAGATFIHFFQTHVIKIIGWVFMASAIVTIVLGTIRYRSTTRNIRRLEKNFKGDDKGDDKSEAP